jgi:hypothetical protein
MDDMSTSSGSGAHGGAHGTVILSDLRTRGSCHRGAGYGGSQRLTPAREGRVELGVRACQERRKGLAHTTAREAREGCVGKNESARGRAPEPKGVLGEASETTRPSSRMYHDISSSSVRSPSRYARVNSSAVVDLAVVVDLLITSG